MQTPADGFSLINIIVAAVIGCVYIVLSSLVNEPARKKLSAIILAGVGSVYWNSCLGVWEYLFAAVMLVVAFKGLGRYYFIGIVGCCIPAGMFCTTYMAHLLYLWRQHHPPVVPYAMLLWLHGFLPERPIYLHCVKNKPILFNYVRRIVTVTFFHPLAGITKPVVRHFYGL